MIFCPMMVAVCAVSGVGETVVLDFQADWCGPCRAMQPAVERLSAAGYPVRRVNIDREPQLAARFGVSSIPCLVAVVDGQERGRQVGAIGYDQLRQMVTAAGVRPGASGDALVAVDQPGKAPQGNPAGSVRWEPTAAPADMESTSMPRPRAVEPEAALQSRLLAESVRLQVEDSDGHSFGSGTIIDYRPSTSGRGGEALVLTCGHIFRDSQGRGAIRVDLFDHGTARSVAGRLVRYDMQRDVGLVSFTTEERVTAAQLAGPDHKSRQGDTVLSVGCDNGREPTVRRSRVTAINSFLGPPNIQVAGQPAVGRSGGGLFDDQGRVIGVCNFADPQDHAGLFAAVASAHEVLGQAGLAEISRTAAVAADDGRGAAPQPPRMPERMPLPLRPASAEIAAAKGSSRAVTEVICIVRSGNGPEARNETIVINNASPELLSRLASEQRSAQAAYPTSLEISGGTRFPAAAPPVETPKPEEQPLHWR